jgi:hypothetical protein
VHVLHARRGLISEAQAAVLTPICALHEGGCICVRLHTAAITSSSFMLLQARAPHPGDVRHAWGLAHVARPHAECSAQVGGRLADGGNSGTATSRTPADTRERGLRHGVPVLLLSCCGWHAVYLRCTQRHPTRSIVSRSDKRIRVSTDAGQQLHRAASGEQGRIVGRERAPLDCWRAPGPAACC